MNAALGSAPVNAARAAALTAAQASLAPTQTAAQAKAALMTPQERAAMTAKIGESAKQFEASFVSVMMGSMFKGIDMGGGEGGEAFKSVMMDAIGKKIVAGGGIGMARQVQAEMLKMQGLS
jgi:Rod binding domain-containing protein